MSPEEDPATTTGESPAQAHDGPPPAPVPVGAAPAAADEGAPPPDHPAPEVPSPGEQPWQRLDPRMLLVHPVNAVLSFLPVLVGITFLGRSGGGWQLLAVVFPIAFGVLQWLTTSYRVTDQQVELRRTLVSKKVLTARLDRVRSVELTAPLLHRLLGLSKVKIGTGSSAEGFDLDSLQAPEADRLRVALLRLADGGPTGGVVGADGVVATPAAPRPEEELLRLDPAWARYAAFTSSGAVVAAGLLAALSQLSQVVDVEGSETGLWRWVTGLAPFVAVLSLVAVLVVLAAGFGVVGYLVTNWRFRLTRDAAGRTLRVRRGLLTTTETSLEVERVRGVELRSPIGLRAVGAGRLEALTVGSGFLGGGSSTLAPYCPEPVAVALADRVVGSGDRLRLPLTAHGPVARRRRLVRTVAPLAVVVAVVVAALQLLDAAPTWTWLTLAAGAALLPVAVLLALDRYRRLGHALAPAGGPAQAPTHLVTRRGSVSGAHTVLDLDGVISWRIDQSFFQRRSGVATLVASTAAGDGSYEVLDVPLDVAVALAHRADPALLGQFTA